MKKKLFTKRDIVIIALVLVAATLALVFIPKDKGNVAVVMYGDETIMRIDLSRDKTYNIDARLPVTLEVKNEKIRFVNSQCPDLICEGFGFIGNGNEYAICVPARVSVYIEEQ